VLLAWLPRKRRGRVGRKCKGETGGERGIGRPGGGAGNVGGRGTITSKILSRILPGLDIAPFPLGF
jgi:hypothetical protein